MTELAFDDPKGVFHLRETLNNSAFPVWGRMPQREQRRKSLIRGVRRGHAPRRNDLKKSMDGF
ncbi:MAG: hypothetical protein ACP5IY_03450, partial [Halothiobacillaceae bacterium]